MRFQETRKGGRTGTFQQRQTRTANAQSILDPTERKQTKTPPLELEERKRDLHHLPRSAAAPTCPQAETREPEASPGAPLESGRSRVNAWKSLVKEKIKRGLSFFLSFSQRRELRLQLLSRCKPADGMSEGKAGPSGPRLDRADRPRPSRPGPGPALPPSLESTNAGRFSHIFSFERFELINTQLSRPSRGWFSSCQVPPPPGESSWSLQEPCRTNQALGHSSRSGTAHL